ncbi:hypothetical protein MKX01_041388 [Papaver californicum]|nr:hypothetical protein MKX01_041388 [Papaver californicum]
MANQSLEPLPNSIISTINPYEKLKIIYEPGIDTLTRNFPKSITNSDDDPNTKDVDLNPINKTWIRIFKPSQSQSNQLLPLIIYFHGGGFIQFHAYSAVFHNFCKSMGNQLSAIVLSVEYRPAPENRLPAAYEDAVESLIWVMNQVLDTIDGEPWLRNYADFSKCFIMGSNAGGNIAYNSCLRASELDLEPIKISGIILYQPHFDHKSFNLLWKSALPIGVSRDHAYCNPFVDENLEMKLRFIRRCLVACSKGDPLVDRDIEFAKMLEGKCVEVKIWIEESGFRGMAHTDSKKAEELFKVVKDFIFSEV